MKFSIKRDLMLKSLAYIQGVVEKENTLPILSNVFLLKFTSLYFFLWPPDLCLIVILPVLFLPEFGCKS